MIPPEGRGEAEIEFSWAGETARRVGTVVHRWLQRIGQDELHGWGSTRIGALEIEFGRELRRRGVSELDLSAAVQLATWNPSRSLDRASNADGHRGRPANIRH